MDAVGQIWRNVAFARRVPEFGGLTIRCKLIATSKETSALFRTLLEEYRTMDSTFVCEVQSWTDLGVATVN